MGANPNHKDLFLELDYMAGQAVTRADIQSVKVAFASAPLDAGGINNPDGQPGINLWVDTGNLVDTTAAETGAGNGSCNDGVDNDGDGLVDGADRGLPGRRQLRRRQPVAGGHVEYLQARRKFL